MQCKNDSFLQRGFSKGLSELFQITEGEVAKMGC